MPCCYTIVHLKDLHNFARPCLAACNGNQTKMTPLNNNREKIELLLFIYLQHLGSETGKQRIFDVQQILSFVYMMSI